MTRRMLVAGIGNVFFGDDGFGVEVARRLASAEMPPDVRVVDFGIRGVHLAYELLDGWEDVVLIDAVARGHAPGTVCVIEPEVEASEATVADAHGLDPATVLALVRRLGGTLPRIRIVACEPAVTAEGMELSPAVAAAVDRAADVVRALATERVPCDDVRGEAEGRTRC